MVPTEPMVVRSLVCHAAVEMAVVGLASLARHSDRPLAFLLHDDGSLQADDFDRLRTALGARFVTRQEADDTVIPRLRRYPAAERYRRRSPFGLKLIDLPLMTDGDLVYSDTDVFAFRPFSGLFNPTYPGSTMVFMSDVQNAYALRPWHLIGRDATPLPVGVNTGLMFVRAGCHDLEFVERMLSRDYEVYHRIPGWVEQTCWAALGGRMGCRLYDASQVRVVRSAECLSDSRLVIGHFTSTVRWLWDSRCMAITSSSRRTIDTRPSEILGVTDLAFDHMRRAVARFRRSTVS